MTDVVVWMVFVVVMLAVVAAVFDWNIDDNVFDMPKPMLDVILAPMAPAAANVEWPPPAPLFDDVVAVVDIIDGMLVVVVVAINLPPA